MEGGVRPQHNSVVAKTYTAPIPAAKAMDDTSAALVPIACKSEPQQRANSARNYPWEGIILKKNKKIVASLTMAMFVLSSVPVAALTAPAVAVAAEPASWQASVYELDTASVDVGDEVKLTANILDAGGASTTEALADAVIWAEEISNQASDALKKVDATENKSIYEVGAVKDGQEFKLTFQRAGKYRVYLGVKDGKTEVKDFRKLQTAGNVIEVGADATEAHSAQATVDKTTVDLQDTTSKAEVVTNVRPNGIDEKEVTVTLKDKAGKNLQRGVEVSIKTNGSLYADKTTAKTDYAGKIKFKVSATNSGKFYVWIEAGKYGQVFAVSADQGAAYRITTSKTPENAINKDTKNFEDFIRFQVTDKNGNVVTADGDKFAAAKPGNYVKVLEKPSKAKLNDGDIKVVRVKDSKEYTLEARKELVEGQYSVRVALDNGETTTVNFTIAKYGKTKQLKIDYKTQVVGLNQDVKAPSITVVDENGVESDAPRSISLGYFGRAIANFNKDTGAFKVKDDEAYLGAKIVVTAVDERNNLVAQAELVVGEEGRMIKFAETNGEVGKNNNVAFQLVDADGRNVKMLAAYDSGAVVITDVTTDGAVVSGTIASTGDLQKDGTGKVSVTANKATKANIAVYLKDKDGRYYAGNMTYNFGKKAVAGESTVVVMTIGSKTMIVNNELKDIDAPVVIKNNRTMVPFRALAEAFGAKVTWDEAAQKVTYELGSDKLVLTVNGTKYTLNGEEKTLDVAPYINNSRLMVPARFVSESLGFSIVATYNTDGSTASAVVNLI